MRLFAVYLSGIGVRRAVIRGQLPAGSRGTAATLRIMRALARDGARDVRVKDAAIRIVSSAPTRGAQLGALFSYVRDRVRFVRDPVNVEFLQAPGYMLAHGAGGDCDDKSTLLAALLGSIGHPARLAFHAVGQRLGSFSHVYPVAHFAGQRIALDPTYPGTPLGWELPGTVSRMELAL